MPTTPIDVRLQGAKRTCPNEGVKSASDRLCCKSPKLPGDDFLAVRRSDRLPPTCVISITLPRSPVSLSSGDEVPHIFTRRSRLKPGEFLITSAKRLLQHNRPQAVIAGLEIPQCSSPWSREVCYPFHPRHRRRWQRRRPVDGTTSRLPERAGAISIGRD
jgi:hypothetical protein